MRREHDDDEVGDVRYDDDVVRKLDDARDLSDACAPWFDNTVYRQIAAERASIADAFLEGQRAGFQQVAAGANPWPVDSEEFAAWERGRNGAELQRLNRYRRVA